MESKTLQRGITGQKRLSQYSMSAIRYGAFTYDEVYDLRGEKSQYSMSAIRYGEYVEYSRGRV